MGVVIRPWGTVTRGDLGAEQGGAGRAAIAASR